MLGNLNGFSHHLEGAGHEQTGAKTLPRNIHRRHGAHPEGERAVLLLGTNARAEIVVWLESNRRLGIIESASLAPALACEKLIEKGYGLDADGYVNATGQ
jgi:hypothetical protein